MRITLLGGAGLMGVGIVRDLISDRAICPMTEIRVCDQSPARLAALRGALGDDRITLRQTDVADAAQVGAALAGADICLNAVPTLAGHQMAIFEAARAAGIPYLDLGGLGQVTVAQKARHADFVAAGVPAVIGVGGDPGMSNMICRAVADRLDRIEAINLYWASEFVGPENPVLVPPYSISTVLAEFARPSTQFLDGRHVEVPALGGREVIDLPPPWGACDFIFSPHSEQLTVPLADGIRDKGIREFTWRLHLPRREHEAWIGLVKAGFGDFDTPLQVAGANVSPLAFLEALIARNLERHRDRIPAQETHDIHFAIGRGTVAGRPIEVRCDVVVRPDPIFADYLDAATSMNAAIAAQLMAVLPRRPGVWAPEEYFPVAPYVAELRKRRFEVKLTTRDLSGSAPGAPQVEWLAGRPDAA